jgi:signal transduction histidine kinase
LVEDNPADARLMREYVREPGLEWCGLTHVDSVAAGIAAVCAGGIDAVLLDLSLPDARGIDAVTRVHFAAPDVPIVVLTGLEDEATALRAVQEGAQDYLIKAEVSAPLLGRALRYAVARVRVEAAEKREEVAAGAAQLREQFMAVLSHDLKGPLTSIAMNAGLLMERPALSERELKIVARITRSADRMGRMIRDFLDFTRTRLGGGFELDRVPGALADLCKHVVEEVEAAHQDRVVRFRADTPGWGLWDSDRMSQVVSNLIGNGLQYSPPDTPIEISIGDDASQVVLEVHNQGEPIPPDVLPVIFDPYFRVRAGGRSGGTSQGLGLGLYISNQIVLAHGGTIAVRSEREAGTTFRVLLPSAPAVVPAR